jgi:ATP-dependent helicase HepA
VDNIAVGQRWISHTEPELGLGVVTEVEYRRVAMYFPAADAQRVYAMKDAPLARIRYKKGATVTHQDTDVYVILNVLEKNDIVFYEGQSATQTLIFSEQELSSAVQFDGPKDRLIAGQLDPRKFFRLRQKAIQHQYEWQRSPVRGLLGPRVQLLPHQLYIADQIASRQKPRALLADEVGLGKTIEAGLVIHKKIITNEVDRVLIVVPDHLLHQWLVEMLRRFNLAFSIVDQSSYDEDEDPSALFSMKSLVLIPLSLLVNEPDCLTDILTSKWDLLVVDEAHHLQCSDTHQSEEYLCIEELAREIDSLLLLTATPEQLGLESHFARLQLLDPIKYQSLDFFIDEQKHFSHLIPGVELLFQGLSDNDYEFPQECWALLPSNERELIQSYIDDEREQDAMEYALDTLLDAYGTGRFFFRNTRQSIQGFPLRVLHSYPLSIENIEETTAPLWSWSLYSSVNDLDDDRRVIWLVEWLKHHPHEKVVLICGYTHVAILLEQYLSTKQAIRSAVFHEEMSLLKRDRAAAYFADSEESAQILICSEIGSEGRNFQFSHHLVLFDLPRNPDLLEQRIGRLDRIGQTHDIQIHVPFYANSEQDVLFQWYHTGLNAFESSCEIGVELLQSVQSELDHCMSDPQSDQLTALITKTQDSAKKFKQLILDNRNVLLELNSCRTYRADMLVDELLAMEQRKTLESFLNSACEQMGISVEAHSAHAVIIKPTADMRCGLLPGMKEEGITATFSRDEALSRDDFVFLTWEHPIVQGLMDVVLNSQHGNAVFATLPLKSCRQGTLFLEVFFAFQYQAPKRYNLHQFVSDPTLRVVVDINKKELSHVLTEEILKELLKKVPMRGARNVIKSVEADIETLYANAVELGRKQLENVKLDMLASMKDQQQRAIVRYESLDQRNNNSGHDVDIALIKRDSQEMERYINAMMLKADAVRLMMSV